MEKRAIWKGYINFGNVNVPVNLYAAIKERRIQFHLLHKRDHVRLRQQMVCVFEKKPVPREEQSKGFEVEEGKYIIVDPSEFEQSAFKDNRVIEIHEFIKTEQVDPLFLGRVFHLGPDVNLKGYSALALALKEMDVAGICTWSMRKRHYLGALHASGKMLRLHMLRYADEVIPVKSLDLSEMPLAEKEVKIGIDLINQLTVPFEPQTFENDHQKRLQNLIDKKVHGEKIAILRPKRVKPTAPGKLLWALEASLKKIA